MHLSSAVFDVVTFIPKVRVILLTLQASLVVLYCSQAWFVLDGREAVPNLRAALQELLALFVS